MLKFNKQEYNQKLEKLEQTKRSLKDKFIGLDDILDQLFEYLYIWYLMPDILLRPMIINLWGMTGVGKTDLIRSLVKELELEEKFLEVELSGDKAYSWDSSVAEVFASRGIVAGESNIVMFDEIQKFRSINEKGEEIKVDKFQDFWELLSDGYMSDKGRSRDLMEMFYDSQWQKQNKEDTEQRKEEFVDSKIGIWQASKLKKFLPIKKTVLEISNMTFMEFAGVMQELHSQKAFYKHLDFSKTLIFISGNLDEAYHDAKNVGNVEIDADIFFNATKKINILNIKEALSSRFRPEQISRFGNIHLIYPSLNKKSYQELITKKISQISDQIKDKFGLEIKIEESILELIYRNGVFPSQGVRPVFSSITEILECNLSKFVFEAIYNGFENIKISYDTSKSTILAVLTSQTTQEVKNTEIKFLGRIDKIKLVENTNNLKALTAVHESGHALIYILNFGLSPLQLKSNIASTSSYGFTFSHKIHLTKSLILKKIQIYLAGSLAEKIIFGEEKMSIANVTDWREATYLASDMIRRYGFGKHTTSVVTSIMNGDAEKLNTNIDTSNQEIEELLQNELKLTTEMLQKNIELLKVLAKELYKNSSLTPKQIQKICEKSKVKCNVESEEYVIYEDYFEFING
jgi:Peptidase family M41/C-terminal, D2-small domain, of ClpB protein/ATPase family associated with various cellular activities (AAA)